MEVAKKTYTNSQIAQMSPLDAQKYCSPVTAQRVREGLCVGTPWWVVPEWDIQQLMPDRQYKWPVSNI